MANLSTQDICKGLNTLPQELFDAIADLVLEHKTWSNAKEFPAQFQINHASRAHYGKLIAKHWSQCMEQARIHFFPDHGRRLDTLYEFVAIGQSAAKMELFFAEEVSLLLDTVLLMTLYR